MRGAAPEVAEGPWVGQQRLVIVEFPTIDHLRKRYASPEHAEALRIRENALDRRLLFAEGLAITAAQPR